jgi:hypothetical protein
LRKLWKQIKLHPQCPGFNLLPFIHQKTINSRAALWRDANYFEAPRRDAKVPRPSVTSRMEKGNLAPGVRIRTRNVIGLVAVAGDAAQRSA